MTDPTRNSRQFRLLRASKLAISLLLVGLGSLSRVGRGELRKGDLVAQVCISESTPERLIHR